MSVCNCKHSSDVFNGVCGRCLMPLYGTSHNENGTMLSGPKTRTLVIAKTVTKKEIKESQQRIESACKLYDDLVEIMTTRIYGACSLPNHAGKTAMIKRIVKELKKRS